jgi:hypothetical protein
VSGAPESRTGSMWGELLSTNVVSSGQSGSGPPVSTGRRMVTAGIDVGSRVQALLTHSGDLVKGGQAQVAGRSVVPTKHNAFSCLADPVDRRPLAGFQSESSSRREAMVNSGSSHLPHIKQGGGPTIWILRIRMTDRTHHSEAVPEAYKLLAGRGLTSSIAHDEVAPTCHPLGPNNNLVSSAGFVTGTSAPTSARVSVGPKSPLTGTIKESNAGSEWPQSLASMRINDLVVDGMKLYNILAGH